MTTLRRTLLTMLMTAAMTGVLPWGLTGVAGAQGQPTVPGQPPDRTLQQEGFTAVSDLPAQEQLPAAPLVIAAYSFVWLALFGYVFSVARRLSSVQREFDRLESAVRRGPGA